jgi:hypothetical protein
MLIGLNGVQSSGKDTVCKMIQEIYPETEHLAFATVVKQAAATFLGITVEQVERMKNNLEVKISIQNAFYGAAKIKEITMREYLRNIGNDGRHLFGDDIWLNLLLSNRDRRFHWHHVVVITDVRYNNEAMAIRNKGGFIVHINRPDIQRDDHESEVGIHPQLVDYIINNDQTLDVLRLAVHTMLHDLQVGKPNPVSQVMDDLHIPMFESPVQLH